MSSETHISKETFFNIIEQRLWRYKEAIFGNRSGAALTMVAPLQHNLQKMKSIDSIDNYLGKGFWGYGINTICNGQELYSHFDVEEIMLIGELNKHRKDYRKLLVLVFKVENNFLFVSTFSVDSCAVGMNADLNTKYHLKDFENAKIVTRKNKIFIEFIFKGLEKSISFQVDDYSFPQNLDRDNVAKYYIETIKELSSHVPKENSSDVKLRIFDFINDFIEGIKLLQSQDVNAECIRRLKEENRKDESSFRYWFQMCFEMKGYIAEPEPQKGSGRIDLKVTHSTISNKIIEFKGWWNGDKKDIITQLYGYLTDFEGDGYIFMINNTRESIVDKYKEIIVPSEMKYIDGTWEEIQYKQTGFSYYKSQHNFIKTKTVYHFIFSLY
jgi:hypothetical protein